MVSFLCRIIDIEGVDLVDFAVARFLALLALSVREDFRVVTFDNK